MISPFSLSADEIEYLETFAANNALAAMENLFDTSEFCLILDEQIKKLTKKEAQILKILCKYVNEVTPREIILNSVWGQDDYFTGRSMDVFITKLRKYLKEDADVQIENIHGIGLKLSIKNA